MTMFKFAPYVLKSLLRHRARTMLTSLEMSRYRFQIEPMIWVATAVCVGDIAARWRERRRADSLAGVRRRIDAEPER